MVRHSGPPPTREQALIRNPEKCRIGLDSRLRGNDERGGNDGSYKKEEARLAELVDAHDLGSCLFWGGGSSPSPGTKKRKRAKSASFFC